MTNMRHDLRLRHFIGHFHYYDVRTGLVFLKPFFQFELGFAGTEYENRPRLTKLRDNLIVVLSEMACIFPLTRRITRNFLGFKWTSGGVA